MMKKTVRLLVLLIVFLSVALVPFGAASAQDGDLTFVYGTNHYDGAGYTSTFVPPTVETVYLLADQTSILAGRMTDVYYWPITNEYKPDWGAANIVVEGDLEVLQGGEALTTVPLTQYVLQYDVVDEAGTKHLFLGDEAVLARQIFEDAQEQYRTDLFSYHEALNEYREAFQEALALLQSGEITEEEMPVAPEPLEDLSLFSTDLLWGFPLNLPVGRYQIRMRDETGAVIPESQKELVIFTAQREGIGYQILSEERWTAPESSQDLNEVIYTLRGKTFYIQPYYQKQYNQLYYTRMNNPQDTAAREDRTTWVAHQPAHDVRLQVIQQRETETVAIDDFFVRQLVGSRLGYEILPFDPSLGNQPTFSGFRIAVDANTTVFSLNLIDEDGQQIPGGYREVRALLTQRTWLVYLVSGIPILVGVVIVFQRKKKIRDIKVVGAG